MKSKKSIVLLLVAILTLVAVLAAACGEENYSINLEHNVTVVVGEEKALSPAIDGLENVTYSYSSSDETKVTVEDGKIKGIAAGSATVTITAAKEGVDLSDVAIKVNVTVTAAHVHAYGAYTITKAPTLDAKGEATHACVVDGEVETVEVPALSDATVWTANGVHATTEAAGQMVYSSVYGVVVVDEQQIHAHNYGEWTITVEPTATATGKAERVCAADGAKEEVTLAVLTDESVWTATTTPATHTAAGSVVYASEYGTVTVALPQGEHQYGEWTITVEPTITDTGKAERVCSVDGAKEEVTLAALTDTSVWTATTNAATHSSAGSVVYTSEYGTVTIVLPQGEHEYGAWTLVVNPTETTTGTAKRVCAADNAEETVTVAVLSDSSVWTLETVAATHSAAGKKTYTSIYGKIEVEIPAGAHEFGAWTITVAPTAEAKGKATRTCAVDNYVEEVEIPALSDATVWTATGSHATHYAAGHVVYNSVYGTVIVDEAQLAHNYGEWKISVEPTKEATGKATRTCADDDATEEVELPVLTDKSFWTAEVIAATHYADGKEIYVSAYGIVIVELPMIAHDFGAWTFTKNPTLYTEGEAERVCAADGETQTAVVPALSDESWVLDEEASTQATYEAAGSRVYNHEIYGQYVETVPALIVPPYANKTYVVVQIASYGITAYRYDDIYIAADGTGRLASDNEDWATGITGTAWNNGVVLSDYDAEVQMLMVTHSNTGSYRAYYDVATGIIVDTNATSVFYMLIPTTLQPGASADPINNKARADTNQFTYATFNNNTAFAVMYTLDDGTLFNFYVENKVVTLNTSFEDSNGNYVAPHNFSKYKYINIYASDETLVAAYGKKDNAFVSLDGYQGTYTNADASDEEITTVVVDGLGAIDFGDGVTGIYTVAAEGANYTLDVYMYAGQEIAAYVQVTVDGNSFTYTVPTANATYVLNGGAIEGETANEEGNVVEEFNINVVADLAVPTKSGSVFEGWYLDAAFEQAVPANYKLTADVTLYANWTKKVTVTVYDVVDGAVSEQAAVTIDLRHGYNIVTELSKIYTENMMLNSRIFKGWYLMDDLEDESVVPSEYTLNADEYSALTVYAKWISVPVYVGVYNGTEAWSATSGNSTKYTMTIDADGKITGFVTGYVHSYDAATQKLYYKTNATDSTYVGYMFYYDDLGVLACNYSSKKEDLGTDNYYFSKYLASGNTFSSYIGIYGKKEYGTTSAVEGYYAHFITVPTADGGTTTLFVYGSKLYGANDVTITDTQGKAYTAATVKTAKSVVVRNAETQAIMFATSTSAASFASGNGSSYYKALDQYFGTYTKEGEADILLDGTGTIAYDGKTGTYTKAATSAGYDFDVYFKENGKNVEYWQLTLGEDNTYTTFVKPMVTITFETDDKVEVAAITVNAKIAITLPQPTSSLYVFRGWYVNAELTTSAGTTYTPTADATLYAKLTDKVVLIIVKNDGSAPEMVEYGVGETPVVADPVLARMKFAGWYKSSTFAEGSAWTPAAMEDDVVIFAKWEEAPVYYGTYRGAYVYTSATSAKGSAMSVAVSFDAEGKMTVISGYYPFNNANGALTEYDKEAGTIVYGYGSTYFRGWIDVETGIMFFNHTTGKTTNSYSQIDVLSPFETATFNSKLTYATWSNNGIGYAVRLIEYKYDDDTVYNYMLLDNVLYSGVTFIGQDGEALDSAQFGKANVYVYGKDGELIASFGYTSGTMKKFDGMQGTYTNGDDTMVVDGLGKFTLNGGTAVTYAAAAAGSSYSFSYTATADGVTSYYEVTLDGDQFEIVKPMVTITFNMNDHGEEIAALEVNKNRPVTLPTVANVEGFNFSQWQVGETTSKLGNGVNYTPTADVTLNAIWVPAYTLTVNFGKEALENATVVLSENTNTSTTLTSLKPTSLVDGQAFDHWYILDGETQKTYTGAAITGNLTVYAAWIDVVGAYGTWKGWNFYGTGSGSGNGTKAASSLSWSVTISATGALSGSRSGSIPEASKDVTDGSFAINGYYYYVNADMGLLWTGYRASTTSVGTDTYLLVNTDKVTSITYYGKEINSKYTGWVTVTYKDGTTKNAFLINDTIYANVTWSDGTDTVYTALQAGQSTKYPFTIYKADGTALCIRTAASTFSWPDGNDGTYTLEGGETIVVDGLGSLTVGSNAAVKYTVANGKLSFTLNKQLRVIELNKENNTYQFVADGNAGKYWAVVSGSEIVVNLDGFGVATGMGTYTLSGGTVTVYRTEGSQFTFNKTNTFDGNEGTYTLTDNDAIVVNGHGSLTVGENAAVAYTVDEDGYLHFNLANRMRVISLDKENNAYANVLDGYQGTYTMPDESTVVFDGYGNVTGVGTYMISGKAVTITTADGSTTYALDGKTLQAKSIFAGKTYQSASYYNSWEEVQETLSITFADGTEISGTVKFSANPMTNITFTNGTLSADGTTLVIECLYSSMSAQLTITVSGNTLTISGVKTPSSTSSSFATNVYPFSGKVLTLQV